MIIGVEQHIGCQSRGKTFTLSIFGDGIGPLALVYQLHWQQEIRYLLSRKKVQERNEEKFTCAAVLTKLAYADKRSTT